MAARLELGKRSSGAFADGGLREPRNELFPEPVVPAGKGILDAGSPGSMPWSSIRGSRATALPLGVVVGGVRIPR